MVTVPPPNQQCLDIQSTPRAEMNLFPLDTFPYEFPGNEIKINFEITEFTAICPFSDFPDIASETPDSVARRIRKLSDEFESVNRPSTTRNRLKLLSKPRNESDVICGPCAALTGDSRMKNTATTTASNAGTEAAKNIFENSALVGDSAWETNSTTSR